MGTGPKRNRQRHQQPKEGASRRGDRRNKGGIDEQGKACRAQANPQGPRVGTGRYAHGRGQHQRQDQKAHGHARTNRCGIGNVFDQGGSALFVGQGHRLDHTACGVDL